MPARARILLAFALAALVSVLAARLTRAYREGPPPDRVALCGFGPTCWDSGCHSTYPIGSPTLAWDLTMESPVPGPLPPAYLPGADYGLRLDVTDTNPGVAVIGFQLAAVAGCPFVGAGGDLSPADPLRVQRISGADGEPYLTHACCPGDDPACCGYVPLGPLGANSWSFRWTAPPRGAGDVAFYMAFNSANWDGTPEFDRITLAGTSIREETCPPRVEDLRVRRAACDPGEPGVEKIELSWTAEAGDLLRSGRSTATLAVPLPSWALEAAPCVPRERAWTVMFWSVGRTCELGSEEH